MNILCVVVAVVHVDDDTVIRLCKVYDIGPIAQSGVVVIAGKAPAFVVNFPFVIVPRSLRIASFVGLATITDNLHAVHFCVIP